jgi:cytochrome c
MEMVKFMAAYDDFQSSEISMLNSIKMIVLTLFAAALCSANAQERGTREEAVAMVNAAIEHVKAVGVEQASKDFMVKDSQWKKKDMYVFVLNRAGIFLAHNNERMVGKASLELRDVNGKYITKELQAVADAKGSGWVDYEWSHPQTKKLEGKSTYVRVLPSGDGLLAVGIYR